ncbi:MAG: TlpA family protein disulfide reductase [Actinomycetota bacterium]
MTVPPGLEPATPVSDRPDERVVTGRARARRWTSLLVLTPLVAFVVLLGSGLGEDPRALRSELIGERAPAFALPDLETGETIRLRHLRGQVVVLNFWASWCAACRREHPALAAAWQRYRERGVVFLGVVFEDTPEGARAYVAELGVDWPSVLDPRSSTALDYGVNGVPETFVIGRDGRILANRVGAVDYEWLSTLVGSAVREDVP